MSLSTMNKLILVVFYFLISVSAGSLPENVYRVNSCPQGKNKTAWDEASKRLKCAEDSLKKIYHCLPSTYLNETIEFCGKLVAVSEGFCPIYNYANGATVATSRNCSNFTKGCPDPPSPPFHSTDFYRYPACFEINKYNRCYYAEANCPSEEKRYEPLAVTEEEISTTPSEILYTPPASMEKDEPLSKTLLIVLGVVIPVLGIALVILLVCVVYFYRKSKNTKRPEAESEETIPLTEEDPKDPDNEEKEMDGSKFQPENTDVKQIVIDETERQNKASEGSHFYEKGPECKDQQEDKAADKNVLDKTKINGSITKQDLNYVEKSSDDAVVESTISVKWDPDCSKKLRDENPEKDRNHVEKISNDAVVESTISVKWDPECSKKLRDENPEEGETSSDDSNATANQIGPLSEIYQDRGFGLKFAKLIDDIAEHVPESEIKRFKGLIIDSLKIKDMTQFAQAVTARDCLEILLDLNIFSQGDVIFIQYLLKNTEHMELFKKCVEYAEAHDALCFYEKLPEHGFNTARFHVRANLSWYTRDDIIKIKETVAAIVDCKSEEIVVTGYYHSAEPKMKERVNEDDCPIELPELSSRSQSPDWRETQSLESLMPKATQVADSSAVYGNNTAPEVISNRSQPRETQAINSTCGIEKLTHLWYRDFHYPALALPKEIEKHISQSSKGCKLLQYVIDEFLSKVQSVTHGLRTETEMKMPENVIACNVNVKRINNQIQVDIEDTDNWNRLLLPDSEKIIKVILIQSRSLYVIEAKLSVYRKFQREIDSANIFLLHLLENYDEVAKLSLYHTVDYFCTFIEILQDVLRIKRLDEILENSIADVSTKNPSDLCNDDFVRDAEDSIAESAEKAMTSIKTYYSNTDEGEIENAIEYANRVIGEHLSMNISTEIKNQFIMQTNNTSQKYRLFSAIELQNELSCLISETMKHALYLGLTNLTSPTGCKYDQLQHHARERKITVPFQLSAFVCDVNLREWREKLAEKVLEIVSLNQREIILAIGKEIREFCETKQNALKTFSFSLRKFQSKIQLAVQKEVVATWQKREVIEDKTLENHPSVLRFIAGMKNNTPSVKVFLRQDDETSEAFFRDLALQKDTVIEFVNIMSLPTKNKKEQKTVKNNRTDISKVTRDKLNNILSRHAESIYANHSNVVGLGISEVMFKGDKTIAEPCIVMHCLDETLVPYGEKQLPLDIEGIPCDIREGIFIFGCCVNCRDRNPNPGCSISRPFDVSTGSVGFLVKSKKTSDTGFLTAAHVAIKEVDNLYDTELLLSECKQHPDYEFARRQLNIVHPSWKQGAENDVIGEVIESFLGNFGDQIGIDAAFVLTCQQRLGEKTEIQIADDGSLTVDGKTRVKKIGQTTGETYGRLVETNFSTSIPGDSRGTFFTFKNCYRIENEDDHKPFFKPGDSGSGVFWSEGKTLKSLGIAFACNAYDQSTVVCRIEPIIKAFALSLYEEDGEMEQ